MKAIVVEVKDGKAAVLDHDGIVSVIEDRNYRIGQAVEVERSLLPDTGYRKPKKRKGVFSFAARHIVPIAASFGLIISLSGGAAAYAIPCSTVTLDINPSVKYTLNVFDTVLGAEGYNEEGTALTEEILDRIKGRKISEAISVTLDTLQEEEYITETDTPVVITVSGALNKPETLREGISDSITEWNDRQKPAGEEEKVTVSGEVVPVTREQRQNAEKRNESPGREMLEKKMEKKETEPDHNGENAGDINAAESTGPSPAATGNAEPAKENAAPAGENSVPAGENSVPAGESTPLEGDKAVSGGRTAEPDAENGKFEPAQGSNISSAEVPMDGEENSDRTLPGQMGQRQEGTPSQENSGEMTGQVQGRGEGPGEGGRP
ncbi:MAG: hypothetical protein K6C06_08905 [Lachnospiraceae bacterium]|nr:hypothetical protein [Lachnospiraceae bacterium]